MYWSARQTWFDADPRMRLGKTLQIRQVCYEWTPICKRVSVDTANTTILLKCKNRHSFSIIARCVDARTSYTTASWSVTRSSSISCPIQWTLKLAAGHKQKFQNWTYFLSAILYSSSGPSLTCGIPSIASMKFTMSFSKSIASCSSCSSKPNSAFPGFMTGQEGMGGKDGKDGNDDAGPEAALEEHAGRTLFYRRRRIKLNDGGHRVTLQLLPNVVHLFTFHLQCHFCCGK